MTRTIVLALCAIAATVIIPFSSLHAGWSIDGAPICTSMGDEMQPQVCSDGTCGAFVVWREGRFYPPRIFAQRISELGRRRWVEEGVQLSVDGRSTIYPRIIPDGSSGAIVVWQDCNSGDPYDLVAQRVDSLGNLLWGASPVNVCTAGNDQEWAAVCSDGAGGCIIAWQDERTSENSDIYAQRIDAAGSPVWTAGGVAVCTAAGIQQEVQIVSDGSGGAIMVWEDYRAEGDLYAQKINGAGAVQWAVDGVPAALGGDVQYEPRIASDGAGGVFITWYDSRYTTFDIYLQRIDASGSEAWSSSVLTVCDAGGTQRYPKITADGVGGAIVVWEDFRSGSQQSYLLAQRVDATGTMLWSPAGVAVRWMSGYLYSFAIVSDADEGAIITWSDDRNMATTGRDIYAQRIDYSGVCLWRENGDSLCTAASGQGNVAATANGAGGMIAVWEDHRLGYEYDIYGQLINGNGTFTSAFLESFDAEYDESGVLVTWTLGEDPGGLDFIVARRTGGSSRFEEMADPAIARDGLAYAFRDGSCERGTSYAYRIEVTGDEGRRTLFETDPVAVPAGALHLFQNHPNPFNPSTTIRYDLPERCRVTIEVFDVSGRRIACLVDRVQDPGTKAVSWNGSDSEGGQAGSGLYFYRLTAGKTSISKKMILLR